MRSIDDDHFMSRYFECVLSMFGHLSFEKWIRIFYCTHLIPFDELQFIFYCAISSITNDGGNGNITIIIHLNDDAYCL